MVEASSSASGAPRALHVMFEGGPTMRVENAASMAADDGWRSDVLIYSPARRDAPWQWGDVIVGPEPGRPAWWRSRARWELSRRGEPDFDALLPFYDHYRSVLAAGDYRIVHWKNLEGALTGAAIAREQGVRFVLDLHENHPYNMWSSGRDNGQRGRMYDTTAWFDYERRAVERADAVLVTIDEMGDRLIGMHDSDPAKIAVVHNTEPPGRWTDPPVSDALAERFAGRLPIVYGGGCSRHRGLDTIIKALPAAREQVPELTLVIVGQGGALAGWKELAARVGVASDVHFEGQRPFAELQTYHAVAAYGVVPHHKYGQTDNTVPHKLYQNMISGLPTLVSSCHCLQRIIGATGAGLVFEAGHPDSAAEAMVQLADPALRADTGAKARAAVAAPPLSWDHSRATLQATYRRVNA